MTCNPGLVFNRDLIWLLISHPPQATGFGIVGTGLGPLVFGLSRDNYGDYSMAIYAVMVATTVAALLLAYAPIPDWRHST